MISSLAEWQLNIIFFQYFIQTQIVFEATKSDYLFFILNKDFKNTIFAIRDDVTAQFAHPLLLKNLISFYFSVPQYFFCF